MSDRISLMFQLRAVLLLGLTLLAAPSHAALDADSAAMNQPVAPFKLIGDIYYVGASDITSYLIATPQGLIVLDGGFAETEPQIERNVAVLGFKLSDVKVLLNGQAHVDHAGGLAELKRKTGATLAASAADAALMARGGQGDPQFGDKYHYEPVRADRLLKDGDTVELGGVVMTAHLTPGHTKGCTTWTMRATDGGRPYDVVFLCGVTTPGYQLVGNSRYPDIVADFTRSFATLRALPCDVFLGAHGAYFGFMGKLARLQRHEPGNPFVDPQGYKDYLTEAEKAFRQKVVDEQKKLGDNTAL